MLSIRGSWFPKGCEHYTHLKKNLSVLFAVCLFVFFGLFCFVFREFPVSALSKGTEVTPVSHQPERVSPARGAGGEVSRKGPQGILFAAGLDTRCSLLARGPSGAGPSPRIPALA